VVHRVGYIQFIVYTRPFCLPASNYGERQTRKAAHLSLGITNHLFRQKDLPNALTRILAYPFPEREDFK
jgi:hypothetical protein